MGRGGRSREASGESELLPTGADAGAGASDREAGTLAYELELGVECV